MKIFVATYGSRGDVQPYIALGKGLQQAGHEITIGTSKRFQDFIQSNGLEYGYMSDDLLAIIDTDQGKEMVENSRNLFAVLRQNIKLAKQIAPLQKAIMLETWEIAKRLKPDFIIYHPKTIAAPHIAKKLGIGCAMATPIPMFVPTSERPFPVLPRLKLGGWYNRLSYKIINSLTAASFKKYIKFFREQIDLPPQKKFSLLKTEDGKDIPVLHAHSEAVLSHPADWPKNAYTAGYWFLDSKNWTPPKELQTFIDGGDPPVYVGFGSMVGRNQKRLTNVVIEALQKANARGIIATGWGGLGAADLPKTILQIDKAPHEWLFPHMAAVIHHGGAGTTAAGLRAGKPTIVVPFFGDQPFWGNCIYSLGVGPKPIPQNKLTSEKLKTAICEVVSNQAIIKNAELLGAKICQEDGVKKAVEIIEKLMKTN